MRVEHADYLAACGRLSPAEIVLIWQQDPNWMPPRSDRRDRRIEEARRLMSTQDEVDETMPPGPMPLRPMQSGELARPTAGSGWIRRPESSPSPFDAEPTRPRPRAQTETRRPPPELEEPMSTVTEEPIEEAQPETAREEPTAPIGETVAVEAVATSRPGPKARKAVIDRKDGTRHLNVPAAWSASGSTEASIRVACQKYRSAGGDCNVRWAFEEDHVAAVAAGRPALIAKRGTRVAPSETLATVPLDHGEGCPCCGCAGERAAFRAADARLAAEAAKQSAPAPDESPAPAAERPSEARVFIVLASASGGCSPEVIATLVRELGLLIERREGACSPTR